MNTSHSRFTRMDMIVLVWFTACVSMVFSPFVLSITMWIIPALGLFAHVPGQAWYKVRLSERARSLRPFARENLPFLLLTGLFLIVLLSVFQTDDWPYWLERLRIRLPFLILGVSGMMLPALSPHRLNHFFALLVAFMTLTCIGVGINYILHADDIQAAMLRGHSIPVPRNHIRFSLLLAMSILGGIELIRTGYTPRWTFGRLTVFICVGFLTIMIHFLSVRTGILALYGGLILMGIWFALKSGKIWAPVALAAAFMLSIWSGYHLFPSLRSKIDYMRYDLSMHRQGEGGHYADSGRIASLEVGWKIFHNHPVIGVGAGNLRKEVRQIFETEYPDYVEVLTPHNQFLYVMAGTGALGLILFLVFVYGPWVIHRQVSSPLLAGYYGLVSTAFMIEHTIENSIGAGFVVLFLVLFLLRFRTAPDADLPTTP